MTKRRIFLRVSCFSVCILVCVSACSIAAFMVFSTLSKAGAVSELKRSRPCFHYCFHWRNVARFFVFLELIDANWHEVFWSSWFLSRWLEILVWSVQILIGKETVQVRIHDRPAAKTNRSVLWTDTETESSTSSGRFHNSSVQLSGINKRSFFQAICDVANRQKVLTYQ